MEVDCLASLTVHDSKINGLRKGGRYIAVNTHAGLSTFPRLKEIGEVKRRGRREEIDPSLTLLGTLTLNPSVNRSHIPGIWDLIQLYQ